MAALIKSRFPALTLAQVADTLTHSTGFRRRGGKLDGSGDGTAGAARALALAAAIQSAAVPGAPSRPQTPGHGPTLATLGAQPAASPVAASFSSTLLSEAVVLFVVLLIVLLALSVVAVIRAQGLAARPPEEDQDQATGAAPQFVAGYPAKPPSQFKPPLPSRRPGRPEPGQHPPGQRSYIDPPSRLSPPQPGVPYQAPGASGRPGPHDQEYSARPGYSGYGARPAQRQVPWQGAIRPPNMTSGPPWGPAPKPEGEPPPPNARPTPPPPPQRRRS
jgi:hypothetical protein